MATSRLFAAALGAAALAATLGLAPAPAAPAGLTFLRLGSGARAMALGEAVTALEDGEAASYNPAALIGRTRVGLTHGQWVQDIRHEYLTGAWGRGAGAVGLSVQASLADGLERRVGPAAEPLGAFGVYEWAAGAAWARPAGPRLRLGAAAKVLRQSVYAESATGLAADLGFLYDLSPGAVLGGAVRNLGAMSHLDREATDLPLQARAGAALRPGRQLLVTADAQWTRGAAASLHLGTEWAVDHRLVLRAGYQTADARDLSFGLGVAGRGWVLDYAFVPLSAGLGEGHRLALSFVGAGRD
ncbi:MAG: PorV/PorQ family protein [Gemmatimonadota bacterium]